MTLINVFLDTLLIVLSYFIPTKRKLIVIGAAFGEQYNGDPKYIIEYLCKENIYNLEFYWISKNKKLIDDLQRMNIPSLYQYSLFALFKILRSEFIIIDHLPSDVMPFGETTLGAFKYINTWHGTPLKKIGKAAVVDGKGRIYEYLFKFGISEKKQISIKKYVYDFFISFDVVLAASDFVNDLYKQIYKSKKIITLGAPRNDALFEYENNNIYETFNLKKYDNIFLYAPTWRDNPTFKKPFSDTGLESINAILNKNNAIMFIKSHPLDTNFDNNLGNYSNILNISNEIEDIYDILKYTDVLVTDYSSACFDFTLTNRPTIFYRYDHAEYFANCRSFFDSVEKFLPGPFVESEGELLDKMRNIDTWFNDSEYKNKYLEFKNQFHKYPNGNYCKTFIDHLFNH